MDYQPKASHFINGKYVEDKKGKKLKSIYPANGEVIAELHEATDNIIEQAVKSANDSQKIWAEMSNTKKGRVLRKAAEIVTRRNDEIAKIETMDTGKAIQETLVVDAVSAADNLEYFGCVAATLTNEQIPINDSCFAYTLREPIGVVAAVGAWNYPFQTCSWKVAPALATGNSIIFKPSENTPLSALILAECLSEAGLPNGVFNVIQGTAEVGQKLTTHPEVHKLSLTGSVGTGKKIIQNAADTLKHVTLELGGKSPLIIFDDADVDNAVSGAIMANFYSTGQVCSNGTRVFVQNKIKREFTKKLVERTQAIKIGDPIDPETQMGPMISEEQADIVMGYIDVGKNEGAEVLCGGKKPNMQGLNSKNFIEPTVFDNVTDDMTIAKEEIFGPVLSLLNFKNEDEVIKRANDTQLGLAAGLFTKNNAKAHRVISQLKAGTTYINNFNLTPVGVPFGGYKMSGIGRENAKHAIEYYSQTKSVYVELGDVEASY